MRNWKVVALASLAGMVVAVATYLAMNRLLPCMDKTQIQPVKQEFEIQKLQKDFKVEDFRAAVKTASEILHNLEKDKVKETIPELFILGQQFIKTMESWAGNETARKFSVEMQGQKE